MIKNRIVGVGAIVLGATAFLSNQISNLTGYVISSRSTSPFDLVRLSGLALMIGGSLLLTKKEELEDLFGADAEPLKKEIRDTVTGKRGVPSYKRKEIYQELYEVVNGEYYGGRPHQFEASRVRQLHLPDGVAISTRDASALNRAMNFTRQGIYRHIYDKKGENYLGIAKHVGGVTDLKWVYKLENPVKVKN